MWTWREGEDEEEKTEEGGEKESKGGMKRRKEMMKKVLKKSTELKREMEERKRHFTFWLSSLNDAVCIYQILHINPFETARVKRMGCATHYVCACV